MFNKKTKAIDIRWMVGDRFLKNLLRGNDTINVIVERKVKEISPSGEWILAFDVNGNWKKEWYPSNVRIIEFVSVPVITRTFTYINCKKKNVQISLSQTMLIDADVNKVQVQEISPSGKWIKYLDDYGNTHWRQANLLYVREVYPFVGGNNGCS